MKRVLIYAQVPPPVHGQSVMVQLLVDGLRQSGQIDLATSDESPDAAIGYVHINPQLSRDLGDIGRWRPGKILSVFRFAFAAIRAQFKHDLDTFYFVPAPPKREALYRDWVVLLLCRLFFPKLVLHWHCVGQRDFFATKLSAPERWLAHLCYGRAAVSIALSRWSQEEAAMFAPLRSEIVPNGIPNPCPNFDTEVWPDRVKRAAARASSSPPNYEVLYVAGRLAPKGLFDAMAAVELANRQLGSSGATWRFRLTVAGPFEDEAEKLRFEDAAWKIETTGHPGAPEPLCVYAGWADEAKKRALYRAADCFIFPTTYPSESFGLVLTEAMAHGCAVITTRWQAVPEVLPPGDPNVVEPHDIEAMAAALVRCASAPADLGLRDYFLANFTREHFVANMVRVLGGV
jgi:glycosyltransferase involved in cell wall biosynthesis